MDDVRTKDTASVSRSCDFHAFSYCRNRWRLRPLSPLPLAILIVTSHHYHHHRRRRRHRHDAWQRTYFPLCFHKVKIAQVDCMKSQELGFHWLQRQSHYFLLLLISFQRRLEKVNWLRVIRPFSFSLQIEVSLRCLFLVLLGKLYTHKHALLFSLIDPSSDRSGVAFHC